MEAIEGIKKKANKLIYKEGTSPHFLLLQSFTSSPNIDDNYIVWKCYTNTSSVWEAESASAERKNSDAPTADCKTSEIVISLFNIKTRNLG